MRNMELGTSWREPRSLSNKGDIIRTTERVGKVIAVVGQDRMFQVMWDYQARELEARLNGH